MALTKLNFGGNQQALVAANIPTLTNTQLPVIDTSKMPTKTVLQTLSSINTNQITLSATQNSYSDCGTISITPSSTSSKILIIGNAGFQFATGNYPCIHGRLQRNGSDIQTYRFLGYHNIETFDRIDQFSCNFMDSPNTTSAVTYTIGFANNAGSTYSGTYTGAIGIHAHDTNMIAMEIAG